MGIVGFSGQGMLSRSGVGEGEFLRALVDVADDALVVIDSDGTMLYSSRGLARFAGVDADELLGQDSALLFHADDRAYVLNEVTRMVGSDIDRSLLECRLISRCGDIHAVHIELVNQTRNPALGAVVIIIHDVGKLRLSQADAVAASAGRTLLAASSARFANSTVDDTERDLHQTLQDICAHADVRRAMLWSYDEFNRFLVPNDAANDDDHEDHLGVSTPDLPLTVLRHAAPNFFDGAIADIDATLPNRFAADANVALLAAVAPAAEEAMERMLFVPLRLAGVMIGALSLTPADPGRRYSTENLEMFTGLANVLANAIGRRNAERALAHQALHDPLTGLPNRSLLLDRLELALARSVRTGENVTVMLIDLDGFKDVNDTLGHGVGDELLRVIARRLQQTLRDADSVARLGGDEFVVVAETSIDALHSGTVSSRILEALREPVSLVGQQISVSGSIGVMVGNAQQDRTIDAATLLRKADIAMYRAKSGGRNRIEVFSDEMEDKILRRFAMSEDLQRGLRAGEIVAWFQPIIDIASGQLTSFEALARWIHPEKGIIPPLEFIELAEGSGVVHALGQRILEQAVSQLAQWHGSGLVHSDVSMSVNVSVRQLLAHDYVEVVSQTLARHGLRPQNLHLELTETILADRHLATAPLHRLRALGVRVSIDDFGTGYSSLSYLRDLPIDCLKIDRSFVQGLGADRRDSALVGAVVTMALELGLDVVAEGVETAEQFAQLERLGCQQAQGYLFGRPGPAGDVSAAIERIVAAAKNPSTASL